MRLIAAPDKFKHACGAEQAAQAIAAGVLDACPGCEVHALALSDGGEGTLHALRESFPSMQAARVQDPLGREVKAQWALSPDGATALIESAQASGIARLDPSERDPLHTHTYGTGQLIRAALDAGAKRVLVGLGGSATSDGGTGMLRALGVKYSGRNGLMEHVTGGTLGDVSSVDFSGLDARLAQTELIALCDVQTPLYGPEGASRKFARQKGASTRAIPRLDRSLEEFASLCVRARPGIDPMAPGTGAAGGLGFGLSLIGATLQPGAQTILQTLRFDEQLKGCHAVITGEGALDRQTEEGKLVSAVAQACRRAGVPCVVLAGKVDRAASLPGMTAAFEITPWGIRRSDALDGTLEHLRIAARQVAALLALHTPLASAS